MPACPQVREVGKVEVLATTEVSYLASGALVNKRRLACAADGGIRLAEQGPSAFVLMHLATNVLHGKSTVSLTMAK
jgi:hypothetical protein